VSELRVLLVGTGSRTRDCLLPTCEAMQGVRVVGIVSRSMQSAKRFGTAHGLTPYDNLEQAAEQTRADIAAVGVTAEANGKVALRCAMLGLHLLLETPIAWDLNEADAIIKECASRDLKVEVAEQFHRRPEEQIKLACIKEGVFGKISCAWNDHLGHAYHGISMIRAYLGFDAKPTTVTGCTPEYPLDDNNESREHCEYGFIEFDTGQTGVHLWSSPAYMAQARGLSGGRFMGERGSWQSVWDGERHNHYIRLKGVDGARAITIERVEDDSTGVLHTVLAKFHDGSGRVIEWGNPWRKRLADLGTNWTDDNLAVAGCVRSLVDAVRENKQPTYGPHQARLDQAVAAAIWESSKAGGVKVTPK
jgi:predicted dehydrogenase